MNHWESIVNEPLCRYKLVSNHKYMHMYKSRNKKSSYRLSLLHPFRRSSSLLPCHLHDRTEGKYNHHRLELSFATKQTKERKEIFLGFLKVNESKRKEKSYCCFCKLNEQRRTGKNFKNIKANKADNTMEGRRIRTPPSLGFWP